jgi:hypothetical protein
VKFVDRVFIDGAMIFEQPFANNFYDNLLFLSFHWSKTMEREKVDHHIGLRATTQVSWTSHFHQKPKISLGV